MAGASLSPQGEHNLITPLLDYSDRVQRHTNYRSIVMSIEPILIAVLLPLAIAGAVAAIFTGPPKRK